MSISGSHVAWSNMPFCEPFITLYKKSCPHRKVTLFPPYMTYLCHNNIRVFFFSDPSGWTLEFRNVNLKKKNQPKNCFSKRILKFFGWFGKLMMYTLQKTQREAKKDYKHKGCVRQGRQGSQYDTRVQKPI